MLRHILTHRTLLISITLFFVAVCGSFLYMWSVRQTTRAEIEQIAQQAVTQKNSNAVDTTDDTGVPSDMPTFTETDISLETEPTHPTTADTLTTEEQQETSEITGEFLRENTANRDSIDAAEAPYGVSPYGFGPFPDVPSGYPDQEVWSEERLKTMEPRHELMSRVEIKLWNQGTQTLGSIYDSEYQLVFPILNDVVYYQEYQVEGGIVQRVITSPETEATYGDDIENGIIAPHLTVYNFPDGGIDPYEFLGLPR